MKSDVPTLVQRVTEEFQQIQINRSITARTKYKTERHICDIKLSLILYDFISIDKVSYRIEESTTYIGESCVHWH